MKKFLRISLVALFATLCNSVFAEEIIWAEYFSTYAANDVPAGGDFGYVCTGRTKIQNEKLSGGEAPKSILNIDILSRLPFVYSCLRTSTSTTSRFKRAERMVLATRSSSIRYLNTASQIGLATLIIIVVHRCVKGFHKDKIKYPEQQRISYF